MSVILLLSFHSLLRTGELLQVTANDLCLGKTKGVCSLKHTKSGIRHNADEAISINDMLVLGNFRRFGGLQIATKPWSVTFMVWYSCSIQATI